MSTTKPPFPGIPEAERTPLTDALLELVKWQSNHIEKLDYETLNQLLKRIGRNEYELFRVVDRPEIPLHNNLSERDIRDYVKKRKISGSTRSDEGRECRDTFASLKKTCRKHGISFWNDLMDRTSNSKLIPLMPELLQAAARR